MSLSTSTWPRYQRILFRYAFAYFGLVVFMMITPIFGLDKWGWDPLVRWVGRVFLGADQLSNESTGSGDMLYSWVSNGLVLVLALVLGTVFNLLDRRRLAYPKHQAWLDYILSLYLGSILMLYGLMKVFQVQFVPLTLEQYGETYGGSSPMRLLWTFMGASGGYTIFAGICEVIPAILLFFRPTRTLGALISFGVMLNVFVLNLFYDVPVKLFSFQLMLISVYLVLPDARRLANVLIFNQRAEPAHWTPIAAKKPVRRAIYGLQFILLSVLMLSIVNIGIKGRAEYGPDRERSPLYGIYDVISFERNGIVEQPLATSSARWKKMVFDGPLSTQITFQNEKHRQLPLTIDTSRQLLQFAADTLHYDLNGLRLEIAGKYGSDSIRVYLDAYDLSKIPLTKRGFNWINESPYNRYED